MTRIRNKIFYEYYYTDKFEEPIYFSIITLDNSDETSLYNGKQLVIRKSLQKGIHLLEKDDINLKIHIKKFKVIPELKINNELVVPEKLQIEELRSKLKEYGIYNELNPAQSPKINTYLTPSILISIGVLWEILTNGKGKFWDVPSTVVFVVAYFQIFAPLINQVPERHMDLETKEKFKLIAGMAGMTISQIIIYKLLN